MNEERFECGQARMQHARMQRARMQRAGVRAGVLGRKGERERETEKKEERERVIKRERITHVDRLTEESLECGMDKLKLSRSPSADMLYVCKGAHALFPNQRERERDVE
jgi:hypothetical protein